MIPVYIIIIMFNYFCTIFQFYSKHSSALYSSIEYLTVFHIICVNKDYYIVPNYVCCGISHFPV